jgi:hypothetical protein
VGNQLILGMRGVRLKVIDIKSSNVTSSKRFKFKATRLFDVLAIDNTQYLLATDDGLFKTTKDKLIEDYHYGYDASCLCHVADSIYLLGSIVWDEKTD